MLIDQELKDFRVGIEKLIPKELNKAAIGGYFLACRLF